MFPDTVVAQFPDHAVEVSPNHKKQVCSYLRRDLDANCWAHTQMPIEHEFEQNATSSQQGCSEQGLKQITAFAQRLRMRTATPFFPAVPPEAKKT